MIIHIYKNVRTRRPNKDRVENGCNNSRDYRHGLHYVFLNFYWKYLISHFLYISFLLDKGGWKRNVEVSQTFLSADM